jgi:tetratricopeptide (TPR) repeat protein
LLPPSGQSAGGRDENQENSSFSGALRVTREGSLFVFPRCLLSFTIAALVSGALLSEVSDTYALSGDEALGQLYRNARFWMNRGDLVRASEFWTRILDLRPDDPRALTNLGIVSAQRGDLKKARTLLDRLSRSHPGNPGIGKIRFAIRLGKLDGKWLLLARKEKKEQHFSAAYHDYERYLKGTPPRGGIALEVLQTESAVPGHFRNAVQGLRQLADRHPGSHRIRLVLARTLINREDTRREGLELLSVLSRSSLADISGEARSSWKTGLIWLNALPADRKLYETYLAQYPEDLVVRRLLSRIPKSDERGNGFHFLSKNQLLKADKSFQRALLADPSDKEAAWGLAIVRMKQKRFQETRDILSWIRGRQRLRPEQVSLMREAEYDENLHRSGQFLGEGKVSEARDILAILIKRRPDRPEAYALMGESDRMEGRADRALKWYERAWKINPHSSAIAEGLLWGWLKTGDWSTASRFLSDAPLRTVLPKKEWARWEGFLEKKKGERALIRGNRNLAMRLFRKAEKDRPDDPWIRYDLSEIQLSPEQSRQIIDSFKRFVRRHPSSGEAREALFYLEAKAGMHREALKTFPRVPLVNRPAAAVRLYRVILSGVLEQMAGKMAEEGRSVRAFEVEQASFVVRPSSFGPLSEKPGYSLAMARLWIKGHAYENAFRDYRIALKKRPQDWLLMKEVLGWTLSSHLPVWQRIFFKKARLKFPDRPEEAELEGKADLQQGHLKEAWKNFHRALRLEQDRPVPDPAVLARVDGEIRTMASDWKKAHQNSAFAEALGGVSVESSGTFFAMGEAGGLFPWNATSGNPFSDPSPVLWFHVLGIGSFLHYVFDGGSVSMNAASVAVGVRISHGEDFLDLDLGPESGVLDQSGSPPRASVNLFGQLEANIQVDTDNLDVYGSYTGLLDYLYGQIRYLVPFPVVPVHSLMWGPELIAQGNSVYQDGQVGGAVRIPLGFGSASLLLDGGILRSNLSTGFGGYENAYVYVRF